MSPRVALAVNPTSGRGRGAQAGALVAEHLAQAGLDVVALQAPSGAELAAATQATLADGVDALVVVGGDGMTHLGVNLVARTSTPLGIIAAGTGNDVARGLGLPVGDTVAAAHVVVDRLLGSATPATRAIDAVRCTAPGRDPFGEAAGDGAATWTRWFAGVLGAGFDALVNERANGWRWPPGRLRYDLAIMRELPTFRPRSYVLDLDGDRREVSAMLVAVANGPSYGGGLTVCPDALFDDGLLDVLIVRPLSRVKFLKIYPRVFAGTHVTDPAVEIVRARTVCVSAPGIVGYADGERMERLPLVCEAVPAALHLLAPPAGTPGAGGRRAGGATG